jgi:hypothetical protein
MSRILTARERRALDKLAFERPDFVVRGKLAGVGLKTLQSLVDMGLAEKGPCERYHGAIGWRVKSDGWRCMYGKTLEEMTREGEGPYTPLRVWRWPAE